MAILKSPAGLTRGRLASSGLVLVCFVGLALLFSPRAYAQAPLDPLTVQEEHLAERIARADIRVKQLLGKGRTSLAAIEFLALKPEKREMSDDDYAKMGRHASVLFYRRDTHQAVRATVDLTRGVVTDVTTESGDTAPISADQETEASQLVLQDPEVQLALGNQAAAYSVEVLKIVALEPSDPCFQQLCMRVFFRRGRSYRTDMPPLIVNLTKNKVFQEQ